MIYLIDDKRLRQNNDFGWTSERLGAFKEIIEPIYNLEDLLNKKIEVFTNGNILFYHESFLENSSLKNESTLKRDELIKFVEKNDKSCLVLFSGSMSTRILNQRIANIPVSILYSNLEVFLNQFKNGNQNLLYLLYGHNPDIENALSVELKSAIKNIDIQPAVILDQKNLFITTDVDFIDNAIKDADERIIQDEESDKELNLLVHEWLDNKEYDNIFLPLCFGSTLSDFNGLRLATHIRCSATSSQLSNIFIYSFVEIEEIIGNEFFDILKTKNVELIEFKKSSIQLFGNKNKMRLTKTMLTKEMSRLNLKPPTNYYDNHSIANIWGIYQLARNANIKIDEIKGFEKEKLSDIYFKWLITKNNLNISISEEQKNEQIIYAEKLEGVKVIGKIDLSKFKRK
jgi:hypothetical protein